MSRKRATHHATAPSTVGVATTSVCLDLDVSMLGVGAHVMGRWSPSLATTLPRYQTIETGSSEGERQCIGQSVLEPLLGWLYR